jgi:FkbM family methyltransferase
LIKNLARRLLPSPLLPSARRLYRSFANRNQRQLVTNGLDPGVLHCTVAYNKYGGYCLPLSSLHRPAAQAILAGDIWEPETIEFLASCDAGGDLIHAGTFFGDFLPALSRSRFDGAKVWAFEPNNESYRCAKLTLEINGIHNVMLTNAALGERSETLSLQTRSLDGAALGGASRLLCGDTAAAVPAQDTQPVRVVTLDSVIPEDRQISAIQLDVEGFEARVLNGAGNIIRRCLPKIVLETLPSGEWIAETLRPLGYRIGFGVHDNTVLLPPASGGRPALR